MIVYVVGNILVGMYESYPSRLHYTAPSSLSGSDFIGFIQTNPSQWHAPLMAASQPQTYCVRVTLTLLLPTPVPSLGKNSILNITSLPPLLISAPPVAWMMILLESHV